MSSVTLASGLTLSCAEQGDASGPAVLMLPGPTDSWRSYQPVLDLLPDGVRAVAVSQRGHGESAKPETGYRVEDFAADVVPLLDALGIERAVLAGHSGSCLVARRVALDHPSRVAGLILEASPTTLQDDEQLLHFVESVLSELDDPISPDLARSLVVDTSSETLAPELVDLLVRDVLAVPAHVWKEMFAGLLEYDDRAELPLIEPPTLLVWGDADTLVSRRMQDQLAGSIRSAHLRVYSGVGHTPRWEDPARFSTELFTFAHGVRRRPPPKALRGGALRTDTRGVGHPNIVHWDDVDEHDHEEGSIHSAWRYLGEAAGTVGVGVNRIRIHPGRRSTPLHSHGDHEEIFFVLGGSGLSWQRGERGEDVVCEVGQGTCLVHLATGPAHTLVAGPDGLDVLAYGNGRRTGAGTYDWFPRIEKVGIGPSLFDADLTHQWQLEGALPEPALPKPGERPANVVRLGDLEPELLDRGEFGDRSRELGAAAGSVETGLNHSDIPPGKLNCPVHCHALEEEVFVVLEGDGICVLGEDEHRVRAGSVVARPPRTRVGHAFRAGTEGMKLLAYGTREPNDIAWYPRSKKVYFRGVGLITRLPELDYWDGE